jgi:hypothetical protein
MEGGGGGVNAMPWALYPRERDPVLIVYEAGWAKGQLLGRISTVVVVC